MAESLENNSFNVQNLQSHLSLTFILFLKSVIEVSMMLFLTLNMFCFFCLNQLQGPLFDFYLAESDVKPCGAGRLHRLQGPENLVEGLLVQGSPAVWIAIVALDCKGYLFFCSNSLPLFNGHEFGRVSVTFECLIRMASPMSSMRMARREDEKAINPSQFLPIR